MISTWKSRTHVSSICKQASLSMHEIQQRRPYQYGGWNVCCYHSWLMWSSAMELTAGWWWWITAANLHNTKSLQPQRQQRTHPHCVPTPHRGSALSCARTCSNHCCTLRQGLRVASCEYLAQKKRNQAYSIQNTRTCRQWSCVSRPTVKHCSFRVWSLKRKENKTFYTSLANDPLLELGPHQRSPILGAIPSLSDSCHCFGQETAQGSNPRERQSSAKAYSMVKMAGCEYCVLASRHPCRPKSTRYNTWVWG